MAVVADPPRGLEIARIERGHETSMDHPLTLPSPRWGEGEEEADWVDKDATAHRGPDE